MVQERDYPPRKAQEPDRDSARRPDLRPVPPVVNSTPINSRVNNRVNTSNSNSANSNRANNTATPLAELASGLALLLSVIAFFLSCFAAIQATSTRRQIQPVQPRQSNSLNQPISRPVAPFLAQSRFQRVEPGRFLQPTLDQSGEVELLSANRVASTTEQSGQSNLATIQLRIRRLDRPTTGLTEIDLPKTIAINTRTNETYTAVDTKTPKDEFITMANLRPGETVNASVTLRVPQDLDRIDLDIPNVRVFRNVPIGIG
ncbi:MAG: hypothetical protein C4288_05245 [Leptolyngbya sp. ERB_1_1]